MNRKKTLFFVSALCCLSLSLCGINNKVYADMSQDEKTKLKNIEYQRHRPELKQDVLNSLKENIFKVKKFLKNFVFTIFLPI